MTGTAPAEFSRDARGRWDRGAAIYDARRVRSRSRWFLALERLTYRSLLPAPPSGRRLRILDAGCGTGELSKALADRADVVSIDLSATSLGVLRARPEPLAPVQGDLTRVPLRSGSVDAVVSNVVLPHLPDELVRDTLTELHRVLRPGGTLIFTVFNWDGMRRFRSFPTARGHFPSGVYYRAYTASELRDLMAASPFRDVRFLGLGLVYARCQPVRGLHGLYHRLGWATLPAEFIVQRLLGLLPRSGAYLMAVARKRG
jgi:SAM-dependent methyltransferase